MSIACGIFCASATVVDRSCCRLRIRLVFDFQRKVIMFQVVRVLLPNSSSIARPSICRFVRQVHATCGRSQNTPESKEETTHYGFETVSVSEKAKRVHHVFEAVASKYDQMNDFMSAGVHRLWKDYFVGQIKPIRPGAKILDVAGGTGTFHVSHCYEINCSFLCLQVTLLSG